MLCLKFVYKFVGVLQLDNNFQKSKKKMNEKIFILLLQLPWFLLLGAMGMEARIKKPFTDQFGMEPSFVGIADCMRFVFSIVGFVLMLIKPVKNLKKTFIVIMGTLLFVEILYPLATILPQLSKPLLIIAVMFSGFCNSYRVIIFLLASHYFNNSDLPKIVVNIWYSFGFIGGAAGVWFTECMINKLKFHWSSAVLLYLVVFLIGVLLVILYVPEIQTQQNQINSISQVKDFMKIYYQNPSNVFHTIQAVLMNQIYALIIFEFPFYFLKIGFGDKAALISIMFPICYAISAMSFEVVISPFEKYSTQIIGAMLCIDCLVGIAMTNLDKDPDNFPAYMIFTALYGIFQSGPEIRLASSECIQRTKNKYQLSMLKSVIGGVSDIFVAIDFLLIGFLLQINPVYFEYLILLILMLMTICHFYRNCMLPIENQSQSFMGMHDQFLETQ